MRTTPPPTALYDAAMQFARQQLVTRQDDLRRMRASLELLEPFMPALAERRLAPHVADLTWSRHARHLNIFVSSTRNTPKLRAAFLELGFVECSRQDYPSFFITELKKGRLKVSFTVYPEKDAA